MNRYFLFGWYKDPQGGAYDFIGSYATEAEAKEAGERSDLVVEPRLGNGVHLAQFDGEGFILTWTLNIPGTERDDGEGLRWIE